ncbi:MAG: hypothetical protein ACE5LC_09645 [Candidatus Aminicenantales bacterium]
MEVEREKNVPFGGYYSFPEGRGTRKTPPHSYLDIGLEKAFRFSSLFGGGGQGLAVILRADIFNVFNSQTPVSFVKEDIPLFGKVWGRQQPRQGRLMIQIKF